MPHMTQIHVEIQPAPAAYLGYSTKCESHNSPFHCQEVHPFGMGHVACVSPSRRIAEICVNGPLQTHLPWPAITRGSREVLEVKEACALKLGRLEGIKGGVRGKGGCALK